VDRLGQVNPSPAAWKSSEEPSFRSQIRIRYAKPAGQSSETPTLSLKPPPSYSYS
jgi:hypothetical protein